MLIELKQELDITWDDDNSKLSRWINSGKAKINKLVGSDLDYNNNEDYKTLLFNYCRYARSNSLEYFENNFANEIFSIQLEIATNEQNNQNSK